MTEKPSGVTGRLSESMVERVAESSPLRLARIAGILYLINILGGFFAEGYIPAAIIVTGNAAATARNLVANDLLYRMGIVGHITILVINIFLAVIFYDLFRVVNRKLTLLVVFFTLVGTAIESANLLNQFTPLIFLNGAGHYSSVFNTDQLNALAYAPLELQAIGFNLSLAFFGFYGLALGYLLFKSTFLPRILGVLLAIGASCYLINSFAYFFAPGFAGLLFPYILLPSFVGEGSLTVWFIVKGLNVQRWKERASTVGDWRW